MNINSGTGVVSPYIRTQAGSPAAPAPIEKPRERSSVFETVTETIMDTGFFAFNELTEVGKNDPALALRYGATSISEKLLEGTGATVREGFGQAIIPTIRLAIVGANAYRLNGTLKDPTASLFEKGIDAARVATDLVGLAGSVLKFAFPGKAALGDTLVGMSYAADTVSHSVRLMTHGAERVSVWKKALAERKAAKAKSSEVPPAPAPTAPPVAVSPLAPLMISTQPFTLYKS